MKLIFILSLLTFVLFLTISAQTTFHGDNARTGVYNSTGPKSLNGVKWSFKTNGPIFSSPAVVDGMVYFGSSDTYLYAVDQKTGEQKWKFKTAGPVASSPAVADGVVYFLSSEGRFYALDAVTGVRKWGFLPESGERKFEAKGIHGLEPGEQTIPDAFDIFTSSPVVFKGRVYFGCGDGNLYAIDVKTGVLQWKFTTQNVIHDSPAIANNTVYFGSWDSYLYALDAETGVEKWRLKTGEDPVSHNQVGFQSSPAVVDGTVYIGCRDAHVYAIDATTGRKKWDYYTKKSWVMGTPAVRGGVVYIGTGDTHLFHALDAKTGRVLFTVDTKTAVYSSPAVAGDLVYVGSFGGRLYAFDAKSGSLVWEFQTENAKKDIFKVLNPDGTWNRASFAPYFNDFQDMYIDMYKRFSVGSIMTSPVIDKGEIYFGSTDGYLYDLY